MTTFFRELARALESGPAVLLTVLEARGSTPRLAGARQFLGADGRTGGTVGGGVAEARALEMAGEVLRDGAPRIFEADLRGRPGDLREGICGGFMNIGIVRLEPGDSLAAVRAVAEAQEAGRKIATWTALAGRRSFSLEDPGGGAFGEVVDPPAALLIVGAGHIGRALAGVVSGIDFLPIVQDERPETLVSGDFPAGCRLVGDLAGAAAVLAGWEGRRFAALVSRGYAQDTAALGVLARIESLDYLGLLGSRKRIETVLAAHRASGGPEFSEGVMHAPIGFEIGAETPAEIAISIAAELIGVLRRGTRQDA